MTFKFSEAAGPDWAPPALGWDRDGYPTDESLDIISCWPYDKAEELFVELSKNWFGGETYIGRDDHVPNCWHISTAGWSGNGSCISAMKENATLWCRIFVAHKAGGHYVFTSSFPNCSFRVLFQVVNDAK